MSEPVIEQIPRLNNLPPTLLRDGAIRLELEQGTVIFRASSPVQKRIENLLDKQKETGLTNDEEKELLEYEELDDFLSHVNRVIRNLSLNSEVKLVA
ncbi:MAG TPA: hypothetical protein VF644_14770 [Pyrinomonadaceae bacterium]|jgi:hypothetical protein